MPKPQILPFTPFLLFTLFTLLTACNKSPTPAPTAGPAPVQLTLDWKPEPEFGGFYAAQLSGNFTSHNLAVTIKPAGEGADTWQLVATGKTEFATTSADQVLIARARGADVVAIFAVYQTNPQGVMSHKSQNFTKLQDIFTHDGLLLAEDNSWLHFLQKKFGPPKVKILGYAGGIDQFLASPTCSQQCYVTSEPILAKRQGADPQVFLIADEGFNPYSTVVICQGTLLKSDPAKVKSMTDACREGWRSYLDDPTAANTAMHNLNGDMDPQTFTEAAAAQKPLIETDETRASALGTMTLDRWKTMAGQLIDLGVIDAGSVKPDDCFVNP